MFDTFKKRVLHTLDSMFSFIPIAIMPIMYTLTEKHGCDQQNSYYYRVNNKTTNRQVLLILPVCEKRM